MQKHTPLVPAKAGIQFLLKVWVPAFAGTKRGEVMPKTLLIKNADVLVTMDEQRREIHGGGLYVEDNRIVAVGPSDDTARLRRRRSSTCPATSCCPASSTRTTTCSRA